jgi:hypothetical protein
MMRGRRVVCLVVGLWLTSCLPAHAIVLRYRPKVGAQTKHKVTMAGRMETEMGAMGQPMRMEMNGSIDYTEKAVSETPDRVQVETRITGGTMTVKMGAESQSQELPTGHMVAEVDRKGRTLSVIDADFAGMSPGVTGGGPEFWPAWSTIACFPEKDIKENQTWSDTIKLPMPPGAPEITITFNSRLLALTTFHGRKCAKIRTAFKGPMTFDLSQLGAEAGDVAGKLEGTLQAQIVWYYDYENSIDVGSEGNVSMDMKMSISPPDMPAQEMTTKMRMNMKSAIVE